MNALKPEDTTENSTAATISREDSLEDTLSKVESSSDFTLLTAGASDSDSVSTHSDEHDETDDLSSSSLQDIINDDDASDPSQSRKKSVRFSLVRTREYNVIVDEPDDNDDSDSIVRRTLGWTYSKEYQSDIETHMNESQRERNAVYAQIIQDHIRRVTLRNEKSENTRKEKELEKTKGLKGKLKRGFGKLGKGLVEAASRTAFMIPAPYGL